MSNLIPIAEVQSMAATIARSGLFGVKDETQAMALMLVAQSEGLHPAVAARDYNIIQNRPAKKSEAMLRDFINSGGKVEWHELSDSLADATFAHPSGGKVRISWDMDRARRAGLTDKDNWKKWPRNMLRARCLSEGVRTVCPSATSGMYTPEEVTDIVDLNAAPVRETKTETPVDVDVKTGEVLKPHYADDAFDANYPKWIALIESGKKTAEQIIAMVESKAQLSDPQRDQILSIKVAE